MKKHTVTWPVLLLGLSILLLAFQNSSHADDCIKLVANKYCLGGAFAEALETYKKYPKFVEGDKRVSGVSLKVMTFIDKNVLDMDKVLVSLDEFDGRIVAIRFLPAVDGENDNGYSKTMQRLHDKYCVDGRVVLRENRSVGCDAGDFVVSITITSFEYKGKVVETPVFGYIAPDLILKGIDRGY
jgi:hypothetical protein